MDFSQLVNDFGLVTIVIISLFAFVAGFIDAVVGGGGLISIPAMLINLPHVSVPMLLGTNKIASLSGTTIAAIQFSKRIRFDFKLLFLIAVCAGGASFFGAKVLGFIDVTTLKPLILIILIAIAIYTFLKKDLGAQQTKNLSFGKQLLYGSFIGLVVGFYDGFFGPGTGSFLVLGFVVILGFEFVQASAYSKVINCITNFAALLVFFKQGNYLIELAFIMAVCNILGNIVGTRIALKKGNSFVRIIFLTIVALMIVRYSYDVFFL
jgi:uncharacterized protein